MKNKKKILEALEDNCWCFELITSEGKHYPQDCPIHSKKRGKK